MRVIGRITLGVAGSSLLVAALLARAGGQEARSGAFRPEDRLPGQEQSATLTQAGGKRPPPLSSARDISRLGVVQERPVGVAAPVSAAVAGPNLRVNKDNSGFPQNESTLAYNPRNSANVVVGANDYRRGTGDSGFSTSIGAGGQVQFLGPNGTDPDGIQPEVSTAGAENFDGHGDPAIDFDADGRAYYSGIFFQRTAGVPLQDCRNGVVVYRSDNGGLTWSRPSLVSGAGIVASHTAVSDCRITHDKEYIAVDRYSSGAKRGNVYVTWTRFRSDPTCTGGGYCESPIYFSQSTNQGVSWSTPIDVGLISPTLCFFGNFYDSSLPPNKCNISQFSVPTVGADGTVYVAFYNGNTPPGDPNSQFLVVKCPAAADCTSAANWQGPYRIDKVHDSNLPFNSDGRQTYSNSNFRSGAFTANISIDRVASPERLYVTWSDNRDGGSGANGNGATGGTDSNVFVSVSTNGGQTWGAAIKVNQDSSRNDQWWPWIATGNFSPQGRILPVTSATCVSYLDRRDDAGNKLNHVYASCTMDNGATWADQRLTDTGPQNCVDFGGFTVGGIRTRFLGDYTGNAFNGDANNPKFGAAWPDCRNGGPGAASQSDIYFTEYTPVPGVSAPTPTPAPCPSPRCLP